MKTVYGGMGRLTEEFTALQGLIVHGAVNLSTARLIKGMSKGTGRKEGQPNLRLHFARNTFQKLPLVQTLVERPVVHDVLQHCAGEGRQQQMQRTGLSEKPTLPAHVFGNLLVLEEVVDGENSLLYDQRQDDAKRRAHPAATDLKAHRVRVHLGQDQVD